MNQTTSERMAEILERTLEYIEMIDSIKDDIRAALADYRAETLESEATQLLREIGRGACLRQLVGEKCVCYTCRARALLARAHLCTTEIKATYEYE